VYTSPEEHSFDPIQSELVWSRTNLILGDLESHWETTVNVSVTPGMVAGTESVFAHVFITTAGASPVTSPPKQVIHRITPLIQKKKPKIKQARNLLSDTDAAPAITEAEPLPHWIGNVTINVIDEQAVLQPSQLPEYIQTWVDFDPSTSTYKPITYLNDFWNLSNDWILLNSTATVPLKIQCYGMTPLKFQIYVATTTSFQFQTQTLALPGSEELGQQEMDEFKRILRDTSPWLLGLTFSVSIFHSLFEFLAFKNDIQFWKQRKSVYGISVRTMVINLGIQIIIFLYLLDQKHSTSYIILISNGVGLLIEFWKVSQAVRLRWTWERRWGVSWPSFKMIGKKSYRSTKQFDTQAYQMMKWLAYPTLALYALYSMLYHEYKGWYSFIVSTAVGFVYMFGFLQSLVGFILVDVGSPCMH
jgi:uncharacterized membrane protein (DUF485 family)